MDNRAITEYKLIIKVCDRSECAKYDPFGLCYVDDCLSCPNARVKIIRQDGIIMRNDFENNKNANEESKICAYKRMLDRDGIELFEKMYNIKFTKFQKWYLNRLLKTNKKQ